MLHMADKTNTTATSVSQVYKKLVNKRDGYQVARVKVTKKVTIQVYWKSVPNVTFNPNEKYSTQDVWKLSPGDKFLVAIKSSGDINPKKNELFVYDPDALGDQGNWARIPGGYAKKLIESSDIDKTLYQKLVERNADNMEKEKAKLGELSDQADAKMTTILKKFGKELEAEYFTNVSVGYGDLHASTATFQDFVPSYSIYVNAPRSMYSTEKKDLTIKFESNISTGGYDLADDKGIKAHMAFLEYVAKMRKVFMDKYHDKYMEQILKKKNAYEKLREFRRK